MTENKIRLTLGKLLGYKNQPTPTTNNNNSNNAPHDLYLLDNKTKISYKGEIRR